MKPQTWCRWKNCKHIKCLLFRGEITTPQYIEALVLDHWDLNWGRFTEPEQRKKIHAILVKDALESGRLDEEGYPDLNILAAVYAGISVTQGNGRKERRF